ncbi:DEAD/DEAH box helicase [Candidatus Thorarchaeota archaeon]|nr:MAG: DEAD/DEAH box helicase [Candidatus Thorarchaeota archaeon]
MDGNNLVLAVPTSSGKTLVAETAILKAISEGLGKALYLVPLKSLAREKYLEFQRYNSLGIRTAMSVGDYDSPGTRLKDADIVILTTERADSLIRHQGKWLSEISIMIVDEIHLVNDSSRGPTLEMVVAKMRQMSPQIQIIALSATISNAEEIAGWLDAQLVKSNWRPVPLREGVFLDGSIRFDDGTLREIAGRREYPINDLVADTLAEEGQVLIFVSSRRSTVAVAKRVSNVVRPFLNRNEAAELADIRKRILQKPSVPKSIRILARVMESGVSFHHAGLANSERSRIEDAFRDNLLKVVVATPTLAAGVNLPARRAIIRDYRRFEYGRGSYPIPILEYKQMAGRAGRPKYDEYGEAVLVAKSFEERDQLYDNYVLSEPEDISSKLASERALRFHLLSSISTGMSHTRKEIDRLIEGTFFSVQFKRSNIDAYVDSALMFLDDGLLLDSNNNTYKATALGHRTSQLYIDPETAIILKDVLPEIDMPQTLPLLHLLCHTPDQSLTYVGRSEAENYEFFLQDVSADLYFEPPDPWDDPSAYSKFLAEVKTARLLTDWISERAERDITDEYRVGMGDVHRYVRTAEWLMYSTSEISRVMGVGDLVPVLRRLASRLKYGVREQLLELVTLRGIGRVRGRMLYNHEYKDMAQLHNASIESIARVPTIGSTIAHSIKKQLGFDIKKEPSVIEDDEEIQGKTGVQTLLEDF